MLSILLRAVWKIPKGKVATYGDVARAAGFPGAARQVAWALHNSGGAGVPWHRVVGAGGRIRLPGRLGMEQRLRLESEGVRFEKERIRMRDYGFDFTVPPPRTASASPARRSAAPRPGAGRRK